MGSSICGGSAIAATSSVIKAKDENIATAISVIFLFNVIAAIIFPIAGEYLKLSDHGFGMWAGTAINDTSSVVAAGQIWATRTGSDVALNYATIVKLTRTLAIIPITLILGMYYSKKEGYSESKKTTIIPLFILLFLLASLISSTIDIPSNIISTLKNLSKYFICVAMAAIGMNTHLNHLVKKGGKTIIQGLVAWVGIIFVSLFIQKLLNMW